MTRLTFSKKTKVLILICGILLSAGFLYGFLYFVIKQSQSFVTWAIMLPLFLIFTTLSVLSIREAFFSYCTFDDEAGIEFYSGLTKVKKIPVSMIQSFLLANNGITISYCNENKKIKAITISNYYQNLNLIYEWLDSHARNIYIEGIEKSVEEFKASHSEIEDEDKSKLLKKNHKIAKIVNITGIIIALLYIASIFLSRNYLKIAFTSCAAYPVFVLTVLRFSKGEIRFNIKNTEIYPSVFNGFMTCTAALLILAGTYIDMIYNFPKQLLASFQVALIMFTLYYFCSSDAEKNLGDKKNSKIANILGMFFFFFLYGFGFTMPANIIFDKSEPVVYESTVINQRVSHGKTTNYYIELSPWIDYSKESKEVSVGSRLYSEVEIGSTVNVKLYKGFLEIPWFKVSEEVTSIK